MNTLVIIQHSSNSTGSAAAACHAFEHDAAD